MKTLFYQRRKYVIAPVILIAIAVFSWVVMLLWNALMPAIFNLTTITFWQAAGLLILFRLLFGMGHQHRRWDHGPSRSFLHQKLAKMTPEEKKEFFKKMRTMRHSWYYHDCHDKEEDQKEQTE